MDKGRCIFQDCENPSTQVKHFETVDAWVPVCDYHSDVDSKTKVRLVARKIKE